jgi:hypothetical protein
VVGVERDTAAFVAFDDARYYENELAGTLGLDFFWPYVVAADWHHTRIYVTPRRNVGARERIARWGAPLAACRDPGCVKIAISDVNVEVTPEAIDSDLDVVARAISKSGTELPELEVVVPKGTGQFANALPDVYRDATVVVVDASPFPRSCANGRGCVVPVTVR